MNRPVIDNFLLKLRKHHSSNLERGVYGYMWWTGLKIILLYFMISIPIILIAKYLINLNPVFQYIFQNFSDGLILLIFFVSESILGMIPPDFFVIWTAKFSSPLVIWIILGILSYVGGGISYLIGTWLLKRPRIKAYSERVLDKYIVLVRKWGGAFIIIAALFPFSPFSTVVIAISLFKYPLKLYLIFGVSRVMRFIIQGIFYIKILQIDNYFS